MNLVLIPAREGSKGVPGKNIKLLNNKPLIYYTIEAARRVFKDEEIIVSTDSVEIKNVVEATGLKVPFLRPTKLAMDSSGSYEVILHALNFVVDSNMFPDKIILLQPTSPFRTDAHIKEALEVYNDNLDMVVSVKETEANPYYVLREENKEGFLVKSKESNAIRRQDVPKVWELNGAIYIINPKSLLEKSMSEFVKVKKYCMSTTDSHDIDTMLDWKVAELIAGGDFV